MTAHCSTCSCQSEPIAQPSVSSEWARRQALTAAAEAVAHAKHRRTGGEK